MTPSRTPDLNTIPFLDEVIAAHMWSWLKPGMRVFHVRDGHADPECCGIIVRNAPEGGVIVSWDQEDGLTECSYSQLAPDLSHRATCLVYLDVYFDHLYTLCKRHHGLRFDPCVFEVEWDESGVCTERIEHPYAPNLWTDTHFTPARIAMIRALPTVIGRIP